jgi:molybdenum cofactor cytidylyltransferase
MRGLPLNEMNGIAAIVLGAGLSTRMGQDKLILPWKNTSLLGKSVSTLAASGIQDIVVVIQPNNGPLTQHIQQLSRNFPVRITLNGSFKPDDMVTSIHYGLKAIQPSFKATLIVLGDQPHIQEETIRKIILTYNRTLKPIVVPSFEMRRGHPWLISRKIWPQFLRIQYPLTPRDFLDQNKDEISYVSVDNNSIFKDIDTNEEYQISINNSD